MSRGEPQGAARWLVLRVRGAFAGATPLAWLGLLILAVVAVRLLLPIPVAATFEGAGCAYGAYRDTPRPAVLTRHDPPPYWGTFCAAGDGDVAVVRSTPFRAADARLLGIAGYPARSGMGVALVNTITGERKVLSADESPRERWRTVWLAPPSHWGDAPVVIELTDTLDGQRGWVAAFGPYHNPLGLSLAATLLLLLAGLALIGAWAVNRGPRGRLAALALVGVLALLIGLRFTTEGHIISIDEEIPQRVSIAMAQRGDLNPNWALTDLRPAFQYPSYNFYAYNLLAHGAIEVGAVWRAPPITALRALNVVLQLAAALLLFSAFSRDGVPAMARWLATAGFAAAPLAVQDAFLARPESLLYFLAAGALWIALRVRAPTLRLAALAGVVAVGAAVKVTFLSVAVLAAPTLLTLWRLSPMAALRGAGIAAVAFAATLAAAMPYAWLHPDVLLNGLRELAKQYATAHPPHSLPSPDRVRFAAWLLGYFAVTLGGFFLFALAAPFLTLRRTEVGDVVMAAFVSVALVFAYFASQNVFFERNLAHKLPLLIAVAAIGAAALEGAWWRRLAFAGSMALPLWWSVSVADASRHGDRAVRMEPGTPLDGASTVTFLSDPDCHGIVRLTHFNDPFSAAYLKDLKARGFEEVATMKGRFHHVPTSTLQAYLESDSHYLRCPAR